MTHPKAKDVPKASQRNTAPAFFVLHHPGRPFLKSSPRGSAWGSLSGFLQPGWVHADIVTMKLHEELSWNVGFGYNDRSNSRDQQTERCSDARENKADAHFFQSTGQPSKFIVFFIDDGYSQHERRQKHANDCDKQRKACETGWKTGDQHSNAFMTNSWCLHGPTSHLAWKAATLAKHAIARKLKNICDTWKTIAGFETIIWVEKNQ